MIQKNFTQLNECLSQSLLTVCFFASSVSVSLTSISYLGAFLFLLLAGHWRERWQRIKTNPAALTFLVLTAVSIIGVFYSSSTHRYIIRALNAQHWLWMTPLFMALLIDENWRRRMINAFLAATILTIFITFLRLFIHVSWLAHLPYTSYRISDSVFSNHIIQSFALSLSAFICGYRALFEKKYRLFYAILFFLSGVIVFYISNGRTGYGIFSLLVCYLALIRFGWRGFTGAAVSIVLILGLAYWKSSHFQTRINEIYEHTAHYSELTKTTSVGQRIEMMSIAKQMIEKRPWLGYGTGGIRTQLPLVVSAKDRVWNPSIDHVESIYLNYWLDYGIVGLLIFLAMIIVQIKMTYRLPHFYRSLMQATLIAILFGGFFNGFLSSFPFSHFYSLFCALCFSSFLAGVDDQRT